MGSTPRRSLIALCVGANLAEAVVLLIADHGAGAGLAAQASAFGPLGVFHDLRWMSVFADSWWATAAEGIGLLVVRGGFMALAVGWARAATGSDRGPLGPRWARGAVASAVFAVLLAPSVTALFASAVVPVSWLFIAAVPAAVMVTSIVHPLVVGPGWWRHPIPLRSIGWMLTGILVATTAGLATAPVGRGVGAWPVDLAVAGGAGVANAWTWTGAVGPLAGRPRTGRIVPVVPVATLLLVGGVTGGALAGFAAARAAQHHRAQADRAGATTGRGSGPPGATGTGAPLLLVGGYGSTWDGRAGHLIPGPWTEVRFSYRGTGPAGAPRSYVGADTVKPLPELARMLGAQVGTLARASGRPVTIVAESEGALVAETYLHATPGAPVGTLLLASPLLTSGAVTYPVGTDGWGWAGARGMAAIGRALQGAAPIDLSPGNGFLRSIATDGPDLRRVSSCPLPGVRQVGLLALADSVGVPPGLRVAYPTAVQARFHGGMLADPGDDRLIGRILATGSVGSDGVLRAASDALSWAASAWQVPTLPLSDYPRSTVRPAGCAAVDADLAARVWGPGRR